MNGKQIACIILLMFIGGITYAAQIIHKKTAAAVESADAAESDALIAGSDLEIALSTKERRKSETDELRRFLEKWTPIVNRFQVPQEVEDAVQVTVRDKGVFVLSQKFETKANRAGVQMPKSVLASMVIEDEYAKTMNWLGEVERRLAIARITSCTVSGGSSGRQIHLDLTMEIPLIDLSIDPIAKSGKDAKKK